MAVTTAIPLQSPEHRSSKSEIEPPFEAKMAAMNNNNNNDKKKNNKSSSKNSAPAPRVMEIGSTSELRVGKSCHQCRQKFYGVAPQCHNTERVRKLCIIKYCSKCLWNRYEEKTEVVRLLPDWECPLCRGICNCSQCMRRSGKPPTGKLPKQGGGEKGNGEKKAKRPLKISENVGGELPPAPELPSATDLVHEASELLVASMLPVLEQVKKPEPELPRGVELTMVNNVPIPTEDAGNAMQFAKFCSLFGKVLNFEQDPETILNIIFHGQPEEMAPVVLCQIQLLAVIMDPRDNPPLDPADGDRCWLQSLNDCTSQSELRRVGLQPLNLADNAEYAALSPSERLRTLVLLCDESLQATELREAMERMHDAFINGMKEARSRNRAAKEKEDKLRKKMQPGAEKDRNGDSPSIPENGDAAEDVQADLTSIRAEVSESKALLDQYKRKPEFLGVEPLLFEAGDSGGQAYWRMAEGSQLLRQELNGATPEEWTERWYAYNVEDAKLVEKYVEENRSKRRRIQRKMEVIEVSSDEEDPPESARGPGPSQLGPDPSREEPGPSSGP